MIILSNRDKDEIFAAIERSETNGNVIILPDAGPATLTYRQDGELEDAWYAHIELDHVHPDILVEIEDDIYGFPTGLRIYL